MQTKITIDNYESFLIDYMENGLSKAETQAVELFLEEHPTIKNEFEGLSAITIEEEVLAFPNKDALKKSQFEDSVTFNEACIASVEGTISSSELHALNDYCESNADKKKQFQQFAATKLTADTGITYPNKKALYKKVPVLYLNSTIQMLTAVAAAVLLILYLGNLTNPQTGYPKYANTLPLEKPANNNASFTIETSEVVLEKESQIAQTVEIPTEQVNVPNKKEATENKKMFEPRRIEKVESLPSKTLLFAATEIEFLPGYILPVETYDYQNEYEEPKQSLLARAFNFSKDSKVVKSSLPNTAADPTLLSFLTDVTQNKFQYQHNTDGELENIAYRGRLLSFQLPLKSNN